ncbi:hypothetical protein M2387_000622 [Klebsiella sp. BIGb0407]|nr:hypothetical protein [Klebsiella sp. BIGb0407]
MDAFISSLLSTIHDTPLFARRELEYYQLIQTIFSMK